MIRIIFIAIVSIYTNFAFSAQQPEVICRERIGADMQIFKRGGVDSGGILRFNFATAYISCPLGFSRFIKENEPFQCAGVWTFDYRSPSKIKGTPVLVRVYPINDQSWQADFVTSYDYGREKVKMNCSLN